MVDKRFSYPDISSSVIILPKDFEKYGINQDWINCRDNIYIATVDIHIPKDSCFPVVGFKEVKTAEGDDINGCVYGVGMFKSAVFCSVDIQEMVKYQSAKILKVHEILYFRKSFPFPCQQYIQRLCDERSKIKNTQVAKAEFYKVSANSHYGKYVTKEYTDYWKIVSNETFQEKYNYAELIKNVIPIGDDCVMFNSKYNSDAALYKKKNSGKGC